MQDNPPELQIDAAGKSGDNINIKKICRVCLSQFDLGIPLFEPNELLNNSTPASLIWNCFNVKIHKSRMMPSQICNECAEHLLISHNFKIQLQQSQKLMEARYIIKENSEISDSFCLVKMDKNIYRIKKFNSTEEIKSDTNEIMNCNKILQDIRNDGTLNLENDNIIVVVPEDMDKSANSQLDSNVPRNLDEALKWLKRIRCTGPPYECKICNRKYSRYLPFYMHIRLHFMKKVQCSLCPVKYFPYRKKYHMLKHTKEKPYICVNCGKKFTMRNHLNQHLRLRCIIGKESICKICQEVLATPKLLHKHMLKEHGTCRHEHIRKNCLICRKENENKQMCEYCGLTVTRYNRHLNSCKEAPINLKFRLENATTCEKCGELLFSNYQLQCHMKIHEPRTKFICQVCGKIFLRQQYLKDHMEIHEPGVYPCDQCNKIFKRHSLLKRHKTTHKTARNHVCHICYKRFKTDDHLNKHLISHTKCKPYSCSICDKAFNLKGNLNKHLIVHTQDKNFECNVCNKKFALKGNLSKHMAVHTKTKTECLKKDYI